MGRNNEVNGIMNGSRKSSRVAIAAGAIFAATCGMALAHGFGGHRGGPGSDGHLFILAKVAGVDHSKIHSAFVGDANLKTDIANVRSTHQALMSCLVSGSGDCNSQISAFAAAQQALTTEKYTVWQSIFKGAPNAGKASTFMNQMHQLHEQQHTLIAQALGEHSANGGDAQIAPPPPPVE
jgi:hypothetical protein